MDCCARVHHFEKEINAVMSHSDVEVSFTIQRLRDLFVGDRHVLHQEIDLGCVETTSTVFSLKQP